MAVSSFLYRHRKSLLWTAGVLGIAIAVVVVILSGYVLTLDRQVVGRFEGTRWTLPARVYAYPVELYAGAPMPLPDLERELKRLQYRKVDKIERPGSYHVGSGGFHVDISLREARFSDEKEPRPAQILTVTLDNKGIEKLTDPSGKDVAILRLEPLLIGSIFPKNGEDRVVLAPQDVPPLLPKALVAVEDRNFYTHHGVDPKGILRAIWVNLRHGSAQQGASTLTQQLARSYFSANKVLPLPATPAEAHAHENDVTLSNERSMRRKINELIMSVSLDTHFSKEDLMNAYINEISLGQDGNRAVHGFGLASQFYFGKPLQELDLAEMATLVAVVRGPSYYDPRRRAAKCLERRNRVLNEMATQGVIKLADAQAAIKEPLGVTARRSGAYFPAYLDLVHRTLKTDYHEEDLSQEGLRIYTSLDPRAQESAEDALEKELARLDRLKRRQGNLEGAVVITSPHTSDVIAIVGGRNVGYEGFNRALDARRSMGSMVKPFIYLTAFESKTDKFPNGYNAATIVQDEAIDLKLPNGTEWKPTNFEKNEYFGAVPVVRALSESMNLATIGVGLDVGLPKITGTLKRFGLDRTDDQWREMEVPAMLLGVNVSPLEAAQLYNGLANGGFRSKLRAVMAVVGADGTSLKRYPGDLTPIASPEVVYQVDRMMEQVMNRGTGKPARAALPADLVVAGKTGTSPDERDSWFAGFAANALVVVWVGYDNYQPTGFTGAAGALPVWAHVMAGMRPESWDAPMPESLAQTWIDYHSGERIEQGCLQDAVPVAVPVGTQMPVKAGCGGGAESSVVQRVGEWLHNLVH
jgi:penicillin-binding protein 1B